MKSEFSKKNKIKGWIDNIYMDYVPIKMLIISFQNVE